MTRAVVVAVVVMAVATGVVWGPVIQAPWYSFFASAGIAAIVGVALALLARVVGMRSRAAAAVVVVGVVIANFAFFFWAVTHSH